MREAGLVRAVGVTGYPLEALGHVAERAEVDTVLSYCQYTLQDRRLEKWRGAFAAMGATVLNAAPLSMGALTSRGPAPWHPAPPHVLARCAEAAALCRARGEDIARVALSFSLANGGFASTVVGASSAREVRRAVDRIGSPPDEGLLHEIEECLAPVRDEGWMSGRPENRQPGGQA